MINLPWNNYTKDTSDLKKVKSILDSSHYALDEVKERIHCEVKKRIINNYSFILCFSNETNKIILTIGDVVMGFFENKYIFNYK